MNVLAISTSSVEKSLEQSPWVGQARTTRHLPHRISIHVAERKPAAVVLLDAPYLAEASGNLFKRAALENGEGDSLPIVTGLGRELWTRDPEAGATLVRYALAILDRWHEGRDRPAIGEVHVDRAGVTLFTKKGAMAVYLGQVPDDQREAQLERFDLAWSALSSDEQAATREMHLENAIRPDRITVRLERLGSEG